MEEYIQYEHNLSAYIMLNSDAVRILVKKPKDGYFRKLSCSEQQLDTWILVRNLEDADVQAAAAPGSAFADPGPGAPFLEAPLTFGMRATFHFGSP